MTIAVPHILERGDVPMHVSLERTNNMDTPKPHTAENAVKLVERPSCPGPAC